MASLTLALYFIINSFSKLVPTIYSNTISDINPVLNLTEYPISIGVGLGEKAIIDPTYFNIQAWFISYYTEFINGKKEIKYNFKEYLLEPCSKEGYERYNLTVQTDSLCINPGKWNVTLSGIFGDADTQFSYINIYANRCRNSTSNGNHCKSNEQINNYLATSFFVLGIPAYYLDNSNQLNPFKFYMKSFINPIGTTLFTRYYIKLMNTIYNTDIGLVLEQIDSVNLFTYDTTEASFFIKTGAVQNPTSFAQITLQCSQNTLVVNRYYIKLQTVLANIGGAVNSINIIAALLTYLYTQSDYFSKLINKVYEFSDEDKPSINQRNPVLKENHFQFKVTEKGELRK